jgi:hypothetical protein
MNKKPLGTLFRVVAKESKGYWAVEVEDSESGVRIDKKNYSRFELA